MALLDTGPDWRDKEIERLEVENERLRKENAELKADVEAAWEEAANERG